MLEQSTDPSVPCATGYATRNPCLFVSTHKIDDLLNESHRRFTPLQRLLITASNQKQWTAELRAHLDPDLQESRSGQRRARPDRHNRLQQRRHRNAHEISDAAAAAERLKHLQSFSGVSDIAAACGEPCIDLPGSFCCNRGISICARMRNPECETVPHSARQPDGG